MGLRVTMDLDTNLGNTTELYLRIDNIIINRVTSKITAVVTLWLSKQDAVEQSNYKYSFLPFGQIQNRVVSFENWVDYPEGEEITIPVVYVFNYKKNITDPVKYCYLNIAKKLRKLLKSDKVENDL